MESECGFPRSPVLLRMVLIRRAAALLLAGLPLVAPAAAFDSFPWGAPHDRITREAMGSLGFEDSRIAESVQEVRDADWTEAAWRPVLLDPGTWARIGTNDNYRPEHHFDRGPDTTHGQAFAAGVAFVRASRTEAIRAASEGRVPDAVHHLGRGLHAVQDLPSHSNYVDLTPADRALVLESVFGDGRVVAPAGLKITGYDPAARDLESPPDDDYPHRDFAKDSPRKNDEAQTRDEAGRTKFEVAFGLAVEFSVMFLTEIRDELPPDAWDRLRGL